MLDHGHNLKVTTLLFNDESFLELIRVKIFNEGVLAVYKTDEGTEATAFFPFSAIKALEVEGAI